MTKHCAELSSQRLTSLSMHIDYFKKPSFHHRTTVADKHEEVAKIAFFIEC